VVSTDCPSGPSELITDGDNGLLVPTADPTALARAISELLADPSRARSLAQSALRRLDDYRVEPFVRRWERALEASGRSR
jgi:glycosyltransferase involved in cell wall biosynthesis